MEVAVDEWRPQVEPEEAEEVQPMLLSRRSYHQPAAAAVVAVAVTAAAESEDYVVSGQRKGATHGSSENSVYLEQNGGALEDLDILKILNSATKFEDNRKPNNQTFVDSVPSRETGHDRETDSERIEEEIEEEVVELEFENAIPKLHSHTMHCPNCDSHITKVILRRKLIKKVPRVTKETQKPVNLFGCLSCLRLFVPPGNMSPAGGSVREQGNCLSVLWNLGKGGKDTSTEKRPSTRPYPSPYQPPIYVEGNPPIQAGENPEQDGEIKEPRGPSKPTEDGSHLQAPEVDTRIDVSPGTNNDMVTEQENQPKREHQDSVSFEVLKSVVYGGLMEVIASLSIVASAAASDATTMSIIALALANLIGGIFFIGHNLWDLWNDCDKGNSSQQASQEANNKYKELFGHINHFPLHAVFVVLSFLVFGIIPPVAYGFAFHQTNDNDFTIVAVAVVSFICVGLLAIFRAYIDKCSGFFRYVKVVGYYVTTAVTASGVSYVAGNLVTRLLHELGLFDTSSGVAMSVLPNAYPRNPSLAFY